MQTTHAFQAVACLVLVNIKVPDERPNITLTDLQDWYILYWLDGFDVTFHAAPDAGRAWTLKQALLTWPSRGGVCLSLRLSDRFRVYGIWFRI